MNYRFFAKDIVEFVAVTLELMSKDLRRRYVSLGWLSRFIAPGKVSFIRGICPLVFLFFFFCFINIMIRLIISRDWFTR